MAVYFRCASDYPKRINGILLWNPRLPSLHGTPFLHEKIHQSLCRRLVLFQISGRLFFVHGVIGFNGLTVLAIKTALGFFDVLNIFTCYYICKDIFKIESESRILCILGVYFYNYIHLLNRISGEMMLLR